MNEPHQLCDAKQLSSFLDGRLSGREETSLAEHLNGCGICRSALERLAADQETWQEASRVFGRQYQHCLSLSDVADADTDLYEVESLAARTSTQTRSVINMLAPTDHPNMLGRLGPYEIAGVIGAGGMGVVFKAFDVSLDRTVAIKVMAPLLASNGAARKRFAREAKAAAAVLHVNVIAIHGVSTDQSLPFLVMAYNRGASLQKRIDANGPLPLQDTLRIAEQIASGLAAAHAQGLVHRDIKPANVLLEDGVERVAITDFGLARAVDDATMTRSGVIAGTPQYMSPEQARGDSVDHRSDLFSLGSVLYAMCSGRPPFRADTTFGILRRITDTNPRPIREINPQTPPWLCRLIDRLHEKSPAARYQTADEVADLLRQCLAHAQTPDFHLPEVLTVKRTFSRLWPNLKAKAKELDRKLERKWSWSSIIMLASLPEVLLCLGFLVFFGISAAHDSAPVDRTNHLDDQHSSMVTKQGSQPPFAADDSPPSTARRAAKERRTQWNDPVGPSAADILNEANRLEIDLELPFESEAIEWVPAESPITNQ